jgi:hypothetical protein
MTQIKMLLTFKERESSSLEKVVHEDFLALVRGTQGLSVIGDRWPITPDNAAAAERIFIALRHHKRSVGECKDSEYLLEILDDFEKSTRDDLALRSQTTQAVPLVIAESISKMFPGGMREEHVEPEIPEKSEKSESK